MRYWKKSICMFLVLILILAITLVGCGSSEKPADQSTDDVTEWSFYAAYGPEEGACSEIWPQLFDQIKEETGGRLVISTYWYGQHPYEGEDMLKALEDGSCQLAHFYGGYLSSTEPVFGVDAIPMLLPTDSMEAWDILAKLWGNFEQNTDGVLEGILEERWNASMVHMIPASPQRFFTDGYAVEDINSLKGHKVRVYSAELAKLVEIMGGTPVSISFSEVYTGLSTNLIDGLITSTAFAESGGFFDFADNINTWEIMSGTDGLMVSLDALNSLPPDVKEIFLKVMRESAMKPEMLELEQNDAIVNKLEEAGTAKVVAPTEESRSEVTEAVKKEIWEPWMNKIGDDAKRVIDQINE